MIDNSGCLNRLNNNNAVSSVSSGVDHNLQHQPTATLYCCGQGLRFGPLKIHCDGKLAIRPDHLRRRRRCMWGDLRVLIFQVLWKSVKWFRRFI